MAEEKKSGGSSSASKPESTGGGGSNGAFDALFWLLIFMIIIGLVAGALGKIGVNFSNFPSMADIFETIFTRVQVFSIFLSLLFFAGAIYFSVKVSELLHGHSGHNSGHDVASVQTDEVKIVNHGPNKKWQEIEEKINSSEPSDWKLAIVDADIILDDMLTKMGYVGEGIADKLKQIDKADFHTLDKAWNAHKLRNKIAHEGSAFKLSKSEAEKAITDFKKVFEEFYFI